MSKKTLNLPEGGSAWTPMPHVLWECPAWLSLSLQARELYNRLEVRYKGDNAQRGNQISLSVREAAGELGVRPDTAGRAFKELQRVHLIRVVKGATFDTARGNTSTTYELMRYSKDLAKWRVLQWKGPADDAPVFDGRSARQRRKSRSVSRTPGVSPNGTGETARVRKEDTTGAVPGHPSGGEPATTGHDTGDTCTYASYEAPSLAFPVSSHPSDSDFEDWIGAVDRLPVGAPGVSPEASERTGWRTAHGWPIEAVSGYSRRLREVAA